MLRGGLWGGPGKRGPVARSQPPKGYAMGWKDMIVSLWGALRGAVGLALAMFIALKGKDNLKLGIRECRRMCEDDRQGPHAAHVYAW